MVFVNLRAHMALFGAQVCHCPILFPWNGSLWHYFDPEICPSSESEAPVPYGDSSDQLPCGSIYGPPCADSSNMSHLSLPGMSPTHIHPRPYDMIMDSTTSLVTPSPLSHGLADPGFLSGISAEDKLNVSYSHTPAIQYRHPFQRSYPMIQGPMNLFPKPPVDQNPARYFVPNASSNSGQAFIGLARTSVLPGRH